MEMTYKVAMEMTCKVPHCGSSIWRMVAVL